MIYGSSLAKHDASLSVYSSYKKQSKGIWSAVLLISRLTNPFSPCCLLLCFSINGHTTGLCLFFNTFCYLACLPSSRVLYYCVYIRFWILVAFATILVMAQKGYSGVWSIQRKVCFVVIKPLCYLRQNPNASEKTLQGLFS